MATYSTLSMWTWRTSHRTSDPVCARPIRAHDSTDALGPLGPSLLWRNILVSISIHISMTYTYVYMYIFANVGRSVDRSKRIRPVGRWICTYLHKYVYIHICIHIHICKCRSVNRSVESGRVRRTLAGTTSLRQDSATCSGPSLKNRTMVQINLPDTG